MKKFLLFVFCVFATFTSYATTLEVTPANMKASNTSTSYVTSEFQFSSGDFTFKAKQVNPTSGQMKVNANGASGFNLYNTTAISAIKSVTLTADQTTLGTWYMRTSNSAAVSGSITSSAVKTDDIKGEVNESNKKVMTFTVPEGTDASYFHINLTSNGSGTVKFTKIEIEYGVTGPQDATLTYEKATYEAYVGTLFSAPEYTTESNGVVTYVSSNPEIATVAENGDVTPLKIGTTTITATAATTAEFNEAKGSYILNVNGLHPGIKFEGESNYIVNLGDEFVSPALVNPNNVDVTYESSNPAIATINEDGIVTILDVVGSTTISANFAGNSEYAQASCEYTISVIDPNAIEPANFIFQVEGANVTTLADMTLEAGTGQATATRDNNDLSNVTLTKDNVKVKYTWESYQSGTETKEPSHPRYWYNAKYTECRIYPYNTMTISVNEGYQIDKIEFTKGGGNTWNLILTDEAKTKITPSDGVAEWTPAEGDVISSIDFTTDGGRSDIATIIVTYSRSQVIAPIEEELMVYVNGDLVTDPTATIDLNQSKVIVKIVAPEGHHIYHKHVAATQASAPAMHKAAPSTEGFTHVEANEAEVEVNKNGTLTYFSIHPENGEDYTEPVTLSFGNGDTTGIAEISADKAATIYDLQGRKVSKAGNGLFIQGGKVVRL